jgi:hypothetical protein
MNQIYRLQFHLFKIISSISSHQRLRLSRTLHFIFSYQSPKWNPLSSSACYMPYQFHHAWSHHYNGIWQGIGIRNMHLLIMLFSPASCYLIPPRWSYSPQHSLLLQILSALFCLIWETKFHNPQNQKRNCSFVDFSIYFCTADEKAECSESQIILILNLHSIYYLIQFYPKHLFYNHLSFLSHF